jgi:hypothetical protein
MLGSDEILDFDKMHYFDPMKDNLDGIPDKEGLYCICTRNTKEIPILEIEGAIFNNYCGRNDILYIGKATGKGGLQQRVGNHFKGSVNNSTLRKSIFSLLGWNKQVNPKNELTDWIKKKLNIYYEEKNIDIKALKALEIEQIKKISPPLNIQHNRYSDKGNKMKSINYDFILKLEQLRNSK